MTEDIAVYVMTHGPECTHLKNYCIPLEIGAACRDKHCGIREVSPKRGMNCLGKLRLLKENNLVPNPPARMMVYIFFIGNPP